MPIQLAFLVWLPEGRTVALVILIAFFLLVIAAVPFEFSFYSSLRKQRLLPSIITEISVFIVMVLLLAGVMLDWFFNIRGLWLLIILLTLLVALLVYFLYWRMRLISSLFARAGKLSKADLDKLFEEMRKVEEEQPPKGNGKGEHDKGEGDGNG